MVLLWLLYEVQKKESGFVWLSAFKWVPSEYSTILGMRFRLILTVGSRD